MIRQLEGKVLRWIIKQRRRKEEQESSASGGTGEGEREAESGRPDADQTPNVKDGI